MWYHQGKELRECPDWAFGFIYQIILDNKDDPSQPFTYYGQKTIRTDNKRVVGAKELKERGKGAFRKYKSKKGKKKGQWIYFEEGVQETWRDYNSSSDIVKELIEDGVPYRKTVIEFTSQKSLLNFKEYKQILCSGCLEDVNCLNLRMGNFHAKNVIRAIEKDLKVIEK